MLLGSCVALKYAWLRHDVVTVCEKEYVRPNPASRASTVMTPITTAAPASPPVSRRSAGPRGDGVTASPSCSWGGPPPAGGPLGGVRDGVLAGIGEGHSSRKALSGPAGGPPRSYAGSAATPSPAGSDGGGTCGRNASSMSGLSAGAAGAGTAAGRRPSM